MLCAKCGSDNPDSKRYCGDCGTALSTPPVAQGGHSPASAKSLPIKAEETPEGERKTVTALFADIKGSTELMRDLDPEAARAIIDPALKLMIEATHRYDGYVVQSTGDGIFALFGAPVAHEDHPQRALYAALRMQEELRRYSAQVVADGGVPIEGRVGLNTGEVVMRMVQTGGHTEYSPVGHAINLASRMQSVAPAGGVVVSEETGRLVEGYFELRGMGPTEVRGVGEAIEVYEVVGVGALHGHFDLAARRGLTRFVGREAELSQIRHALELAIVGSGQVVAVMAEAGTGKSRLFHEFKATIPLTCKVLEAYSVSHGKASAWLPVLELLRGYFGIGDADDAAARREKVAAVLNALDPMLEDTLPYLFGLLGIVEGADPLAQMAPPIRLQRTLNAIKRIILSESFKQPVVVIFEDLHWIDAQTQALLDGLADSVAGARVLLLVNYRPEYRDEWTSKSYYSQLRLPPLDSSDGAAMLASLLGEAVELNPLKRLIGERTGGNPFFIEEIVQALFDEGALVRNGVVKVTRALLQLRLPPTVQGILAARIDRQPGDRKQLLQTLAVIGRESPIGLLRQVAPHEDNRLERMLAELQAAEFIYEEPVTGGVEYVFKHALTQEVAYNSLLMERRKQLHERAGRALEAIFASQLDDHLGQLAHHYSLSDNTDKAVEYLGRAGQQAVQRSVNVDAIVSLTSAIDLLQTRPEGPERNQRELLLQLALGVAQGNVNGWASPEAERAFSSTRELCRQLGDPPELFPVLFGLWGVNFIKAEFRRADELAQQLLPLAERTNDPARLLYARFALGETAVHMGEFLQAKEHLEIALSIYDPALHHPLVFQYTGVDAGVTCTSYAAHTLWTLGYPDQALERDNESVILGRAVSHPQSLASAYCFSGILRQKIRGEARTAQELEEKVISLSVEHGLINWLPPATIMRGWAISKQGRKSEGIALMQEGLAALQATGAGIGVQYYLCLLAEAYAEMGSFDEGLGALAEVLTIAEKSADRYCESETYRLRGELLLHQNEPNAADVRRCFERAIEIAHEQSAKSYELRATTSLARVLDQQGRRGEARMILADIYNWFTEGFDTADLKDAKALLDRLNSKS